MIEKNANFQKMLSEKHSPWKRIKKRVEEMGIAMGLPHMKENALNECNTNAKGSHFLGKKLFGWVIHISIFRKVSKIV